MVERKDAFRALIETAMGARHAHYPHTVDYAKELTEMCGALDPTELIRRFDLREDEDQFNNRVNLTQNILLPVIGRIQKPFQKALRADDITINVEPSDKLADAQGDFYGKDGIRKFLDDQLLSWQCMDPNAWLLIDIGPFDPDIQKAQPYPIFISSDKALNFSYENNIAKWLCCQTGGDIIIYCGDFGLKLTPVETKDATDYKIEDGKEVPEFKPEMIGKIIEAKGEKYILTLFEPKTGTLQAKQIGYIRDPRTKHRTYVSPIHNAIPTLRRTIRSGSEMDMAISLHIYPKKYVVQRACNGMIHEGTHLMCKGGHCSTNAGNDIVCTTCSGTGLEPIHRSSQDVVAVPDKLIGPDMKLPDLYHYEQTDIDTPKFLQEVVDKLSDQCHMDIFQTRYYTENTGGQKTATEAAQDYEGIYDTLWPFTQAYASLYEFCLTLSGKYRDITFEKAEMLFPRDLQLQSLGSLVSAYTSSESAPLEVRKSLGDKILRATYKNSPSEYQKAQVKRSFEPFADRSFSEIQTIISTNLCSKLRAWQWANHDEIFQRIEDEIGDKFYAYEPSKQKQEYERISQEIYNASMTVEIQLPGDDEPDAGGGVI